MAASKSLVDLTCCSICLETFTRPKMLPCQHTYCYSCLLSIGKDQTKIPCPQCREECDIPEEGIADFKDNILANNLIELCLAQRDILCADCELKPASFPCEHCNKRVCAPCFSAHLNLSMELKMSLKEVEETISRRKTEVSTGELERLKDECCKSLEDLKAFRRRKLLDLLHSSHRLEKFMEMVSRVQSDLLRTSEDTNVPDDSHFTTLASKADNCATIGALKRLINNVCDLKTALRLFRNPDEHLQFVPNLALQESEALGHFEVGQTVVEVRDRYEVSADELLEILAGIRETIPEQYSNPETQRADHSIQLKLQEVQIYRQNQLPSNVNYADKGLGWVTVVGQADPSQTRCNLIGAAYHVATGDVYAADRSNNRVMVYPSSARRPRVFYTVTCPHDVAVSTDGTYVYIAAQGLLIKVGMDGENVKTIHKCSLGPLNKCLSVVCHNECTVLLDCNFNCVIVFDESCRELRCFGRKQLQAPTAVAVSGNGEIFVTNKNDHSIEVFNWKGQFLETFLSSEGEMQSFGEVAVDAAGFISVTNKKDYTIDIYDRQKNKVTTISRSGELPGQLNFPFRLTLLPDGRIMVTDKIEEDGDSSITRLQIF